MAAVCLRTRPAGLISTAVFAPATDPASPRITKTAEAEAAAAAAPTPAAAASQQASPSSWPAPAPQHTRSVTVVTPACVAPGPAAAAAPRLPSSDYLAALDSAGTNPFDAPALRQQEEREHAAAVAAAQKAAQKQNLLQQVGWQAEAGGHGAGQRLPGGCLAAAWWLPGVHSLSSCVSAVAAP